MARIRRGFIRRRVRRNWQWVRFTSNDVTTVVAGTSQYVEDLLSSYRLELGIGVNLPDITIWRIRLRISIHITFPAVITNPEAYGCTMALLVDNLGFTFPLISSHAYQEQFLWYETVYFSDMISQGSQGSPPANGTGYLFKSFDVKARRRVRNLDDSLILLVSPTGGLTNAFGMSYSGSVLLSMGRR